MDTSITGTLPANNVIYAVHRWAKDGKNHRFERAQFEPGAETFWTKCMSGLQLPQRMAFADELSEELGPGRDTSNDDPACFCTEPRRRKRTW